MSTTPNQPEPVPPRCNCPDWATQIEILNGPIVLQSIRSGGAYQYPGKQFTHCPWCGNRLVDITAAPQQLSEKGGDEKCDQSSAIPIRSSQAPEVTKGASPQQPPPAESEPSQKQIEEVCRKMTVQVNPYRNPDAIVLTLACWHLRELSRATASLRKSLEESRAECEKWKSELSHISENLCGTKVEGEVSHEYVYAFVEGEIEKQYELRCEMEEWFSKAYQNATGAPLTLFGKAECQKAVDNIMSYVEKDRQQLTTLRDENEQLRKELKFVAWKTTANFQPSFTSLTHSGLLELVIEINQRVNKALTPPDTEAKE
jgi:hypothetical protein